MRNRTWLSLLALSVLVSVSVGIAAGPAGASTPRIDDPSAWWGFEEGSGTTAFDVAGFHNATLHAPAGFTGPGPTLEGSNAGALAFNGAGYATAPATGLGDLQQFTLVSWVQITTRATAEANLLSIDGKAALTVVPDTSTSVGFRLISPTFSRTIYAHPNFTGGAWHLIVATYDGATMRLYSDGAQLNSLPGSVSVTAGTGITLGDSAHPQSVSIDEARIYPRALSVTEVRRLAFNCDVVSQIPLSECQALEDFYLATDGGAWSASPNWLTNTTPCTWSGVLCNNGHVIALGLPTDGLTGTLPLSLSNLPQLIALDVSGNRLVGALPATLGSLTKLQTLNVRNNTLSGGLPGNIGRLTALQALNLANNRITGDVPTGITALNSLTSLDVTNNGIYPSDAGVRDFFSARQPDWLASQTIPPTDVHTSGVTGTTATLGWTPIAYTADGGYYEVLSVDPDTGATTPVGRTADKVATGFTVTGLTSGQSYSFVVRTVTPPHGPQPSTVTSEVSPRVTSTTAVPPGAPTITSATPGNGTVTVAFTPPASDGGAPITGYTVTAAPGGATATGSTSPLAVTGLTNGVAYTFTVTATNAAGSGPASAPSAPVTPSAPKVTTEDTSATVAWNSWAGVRDPAASGGGYRISPTAGATGSFAFSGSSVTWIARTGPDRGRATVTVDGISNGTVDLYSPTPGGRSSTYGGLTSAAHTVTVTVLGTKRAAATGTSVTVDAFAVGTTRTQETARTVAFDTWTGTTSTAATGGGYRSSGTAGATATFAFTGTGVDWVTAQGPAFGRVAVAVDGGPATTVDLYRATSRWRVVGRSFAGLSPGSHTITVRVLGTRNAASSGTQAVVDAFRVVG
jgi:hypothetical protein